MTKHTQNKPRLRGRTDRAWFSSQETERVILPEEEREKERNQNIPNKNKSLRPRYAE